MADLVLMRKIVRDLMEGSKASGINMITSSLTVAENNWEQLKTALTQREAEANVREKQLCHFEAMKDLVIRWLQDMDQKMNKLMPAALDLAVLDQQLESLEVFSVSFSVIFV